MNKLILKSITWRVLALVSSYTIAILFGLSSKQALAITIILNILNHGMYLMHDYIWLLIDKARIKKAFKEELETAPAWYKPECTKNCKECECL
jgi:uncharacterized membrane protein